MTSTRAKRVQWAATSRLSEKAIAAALAGQVGSPVIEAVVAMIDAALVDSLNDASDPGLDPVQSKCCLAGIDQLGRLKTDLLALVNGPQPEQGDPE